MSGEPLVSVIVPTHNRAGLVQLAVRAVLAQTHRNIELIVVDDASTDETQQVLGQIGDARLRLESLPMRRGAVRAREHALVRASGSYVAMLDDDDEWLPEKLEQQVALLEAHPDLDLAHAGWQWSGEAERGQARIRVPDSNGRISGLPRWLYNVNEFLIRREALLAQLPLHPGYYEHTDLLLRLGQSSSAFGSVPVVLSVFHSHRGSRVSDAQAPEKAAALGRLIAEHEAFMRSDPRGWAQVNLTLGALRLEAGDRLAARRCFIASLRSRPLYARGWLWLLRSIAPGLRAARGRRTRRGARSSS